MEIENEFSKAYIGGNATLKCRSQAFPPSENYWTFGNKETISSGINNIQEYDFMMSFNFPSSPGGRYKVEIWVGDLFSQMQLHITGVKKSDFKKYRCVARNLMGEDSRELRLIGKISVLLNTSMQCKLNVDKGTVHK